MANSEHLEMLAKGVEVWNEWREENLEMQPDFQDSDLKGFNFKDADLSEADFRGSNLSEADLRRADLSEADLRGANLSEADLRGAKLIYANLSDTNLTAANLSRTDLVRVQALKTNFQNANLTGACITDWYINSETQFDNVVCEYIYLQFTYQDNKIVFTDRRPRNPNKVVTPKDLAQFIQPSRETLDLIFKEGIDWNAFLTAFQSLQMERDRAELSLQGIEKKRDGSFLVRVDAPDNTDKSEVEKSFQSKYDRELQQLEAGYREKWQIKEEQIEIYKQQNTNLTDIVKLLAARDIRTVRTD
ncbi:MAG: pentapeptide repeat-containing protein [Spirulina sp.]